jgi:hypothetical protein
LDSNQENTVAGKLIQSHNRLHTAKYLSPYEI